MPKLLCPHCSSPLRIRTSRQVVDTVRDIYGCCDNELCLARPIMQVFHKGDAQPPISQMSTTEALLIRALLSLSADQRQTILKQLEQTELPETA